jgi:hypothetical protein
VRLTMPRHGIVVRQNLLEVEVEVDAFHVGSDGAWCLALGEEPAVCLQRSDLHLMLDFVPHAAESRAVGLRAELKSNIYRDVIARSDPVEVIVPPLHEMEGIGADGKSGARHGVIVHRVDIAAAG